MTIWCICPFAREGFLNNVLENFDRQTYEDRRLLVVANGSAYKISFGHKRTKLLRSRTNLSDPMNKGLEYLRKRAGKDDWFCKFDDDDYYGPDYLSSIASVAESGANAVARYKVWMRTPDNILWTVDNGDMMPHGPTLASRVDIAEDFPEVQGWGEDGLWVQKMQKKGIVFTRGPLEGFCWLRYQKGHGHSFPLQPRHFLMLDVNVDEYGLYNEDVVNGIEKRSGKVLQKLPIDMADFSKTLSDAASR